MKVISIFNNKGGVGKTTLTFHLAHALAEMGHRTLIVDMDPQCNLTILGLREDTLDKVWKDEEAFIDDFVSAKNTSTNEEFQKLTSSPRSIHFLLKPTEDGTADLEQLPPPFEISPNLHLIPGRLTMHLYEDAIARRWSDVYQGDPLAVRTLTKPRDIALKYSKLYNYDFVILDTSPSLGTLNRVIISTADGIVVPCMPDMFSLYGIKNIGNALGTWEKQFQTIYHLLSEEKRNLFPLNFVKLLGFTIYNAKKYTGGRPWDLATAHYNYAQMIPEKIKQFVPQNFLNYLPEKTLRSPIGEMSIMHTHNTLPAMAQKYHVPMWKVPAQILDADDQSSITGNRSIFEATKSKYMEFTKDFLTRVSKLD